MTTALKTKKTKIEERHPPKDIREVTKARRAWLAAELATVNATEGLEGKIVGQGSYQCISVYKITQTEGRLRHRGHCQVCGHHQVVQGGLLVDHGYQRPGWGYIVNVCPGQNQSPLQTTDVLTVRLLAESKNTLVELEAEKVAAHAAYDAALSAVYTGDTQREEYETFPTVKGLRHKQEPTPEQIKEVTILQKAWAARYPLRNALRLAENARAAADRAEWLMRQQVAHFELLLSWNLVGKPLIEEVVV